MCQDLGSCHEQNTELKNIARNLGSILSALMMMLLVSSMQIDGKKSEPLGLTFTGNIK
jgi:hypothetical protein